MKGFGRFSRRGGIAILLVIALSTSSLLKAGTKNGSDMFLRLWDYSAEKNSETYDRKITSLFVRSGEKGSVEITMLIAYSKSITNTARDILNEQVTPLIFSVSSLPLESAEFKPEELKFEQNGRIWSPEENSDMFPLGKNANFGGLINESRIHQGVILLPGWFDVSQPIEISYNGYVKKIYLGYR
ncbi:MAG: hypothetical protein ONB05_10930 [candidate division KSB1 bacterium]|nr:hypothetical protein [candidate division KSB1 bacterium]